MALHLFSLKWKLVADKICTNNVWLYREMFKILHPYLCHFFHFCILQYYYSKSQILICILLKNIKTYLP